MANLGADTMGRSATPFYDKVNTTYTIYIYIYTIEVDFYIILIYYIVV